MKKIWILLCMLVACTSVKKEHVLLVGISPDFPPFAMKVNGELAGSDVEMIKKIGIALNKKVEFKEMDFNALIPALLARKVDMAVSGISSTAERRKKVLFSKPYYVERNCVLFNKDKNTFETVNEIEEKKVAATMGTTQQTVVEKHFKNYKMYNNNFQLLEELKLGRIDAFVVGEAQCVEFANKYKNFGFFLLPDQYNAESSFAIALRKEDQVLADEINKVIDHDL